MPPDQTGRRDEPTASIHASRGHKSEGGGPLTPGQILGDRYRIVSLLGQGGMGEVWQAFDLKLQVDVALKSLRQELFEDMKAMELLRSEVRAARQVVSPNVCRIFDLVVEEGRELVSMEYIDGRTLLQVLQERGPLDLRESNEVASQFLAGLEAIHQAGLVHRDVKPENIMITRAGRVVLMDFGVAKGIAEGHSGTVSGTPAYMSPEQMRGDELDARSDVFSAGIVLAEMISAESVGERTTREGIWRGIRKDPPALPDGPWRPVLERAVSTAREKRYRTASALARALEEVTLRVEGVEDKRPYPGLASFTETDAEFFFGREADVEAMWKKLQRANLLAIVGASGAGKTSFIQAGLIPALPEGWRHAICRPGSSPFVSLGEALAAELSGDFEALRQLLRFDEPEVAVSMFKRWREQHTGVLLVVDQFEELFTQNPPETQARFAELLGSVASEADVHVLLCMRDDFFLRCHDFPALSAVFSELTPIGPPTGAALRRALVQPALACGYRFDDENLVDEMLSQVSGERGALPLLAFAVSRLWENRDRETGLLTREAFERIGGVGGALASHAEAALERIGTKQQPIVRDIFRNLMTAEGTRARMDMEELLSVYGERNASDTGPGDRTRAREVLRELIDARLLTSFELRQTGDEQAEPRQQIEIIHESLLTSWPRLVRWRTQDADSAQLRDQLRQAAQLWEERSRSEDLLWTGTAFNEFQVWRERYPGGLTETEQAFARAMVDRAERQRRRRRRLTIAAFAALAVTAATIASFWRLSEVRRHGAEASRLHALGQLELERFPSRALAFAIASLELADDLEVRRLALEALWRGPTALVFEPARGRRINTVNFSPDGRRLAVGDQYSGTIDIWSMQAHAPITLRDTTSQPVFGLGYPRFAAASDVIVGFFQPDDGSWKPPTDGSLRLWSSSEQEVVCKLPFKGSTLAYLSPFRRHLMTVTQPSQGAGAEILRAWEVDGREPSLIGQVPIDLPGMIEGKAGTTVLSDVDPSGTWLAYADGKALKLVGLTTMESDPPHLIGRHKNNIEAVAFHPDGERVVALSRGQVHVWSRTSSPPRLLQRLQGRPGIFGMHIDPAGIWVALPHADGSTQLLDLEGPPSQEPLELQWRARGQVEGVAFHPGGRWIVTGNSPPTFWPLSSRYPKELRGGWGSPLIAPVFAPDGSWLACIAGDSVKIWGLSPEVPDRTLPSESTACCKWGLHVDPHMRFLVYRDADGVRKISLHNGSIEELPFDQYPWSGAIDPTGRYIAAGYMDDPGGAESYIHILDLETGMKQLLEFGQESVDHLQFMSNGDLLSATAGKLVRWNLANRTHELLLEKVRSFDLSSDGRSLLVNANNRAVFHDLETGASRELSSHGSLVCKVAFDASGTLAITGDWQGAVRVGPLTGEEPHVLLRHKGNTDWTPGTRMLAVDPKGRWIASTAEEREGRVVLWPMPEGEPILGLPSGQFLALLKTLSNIRVVPKEETPTGYGFDYAPFPGWETPPTW